MDRGLKDRAGYMQQEIKETSGQGDCRESCCGMNPCVMGQQEGTTVGTGLAGTAFPLGGVDFCPVKPGEPWRNISLHTFKG